MDELIKLLEKDLEYISHDLMIFFVSKYVLQRKWQYAHIVAVSLPVPIPVMREASATSRFRENKL